MAARAGLIALIAVSAGLLGYALGRSSPAKREGASVSAHTASSFICPMHADIHSESAGSCPVCGMDLIERAHGATAHAAEGGPPVVTISVGSVILSPDGPRHGDRPPSVHAGDPALYLLWQKREL
jgi:hypothetical protein